MNEHFYERQVIRYQPYLETVEAAMMQCALEIHQEPSETWGHENRASVALAIFLNPEDTKRFSRFFAWLSLFNPTIRAQVFHGENDIRPQEIDGAELRALIKGAWDVAANVEPEEA